MDACPVMQAQVWLFGGRGRSQEGAGKRGGDGKEGRGEGRQKERKGKLQGGEGKLEEGEGKQEGGEEKQEGDVGGPLAGVHANVSNLDLERHVVLSLQLCARPLSGDSKQLVHAHRHVQASGKPPAQSRQRPFLVNPIPELEPGVLYGIPSPFLGLAHPLKQLPVECGHQGQFHTHVTVSTAYAAGSWRLRVGRLRE